MDELEWRKLRSFLPVSLAFLAAVFANLVMLLDSRSIAEGWDKFVSSCEKASTMGLDLGVDFPVPPDLDLGNAPR